MPPVTPASSSPGKFAGDPHGSDVLGGVLVRMDPAAGDLAGATRGGRLILRDVGLDGDFDGIKLCGVMSARLDRCNCVLAHRRPSRRNVRRAWPG